MGEGRRRGGWFPPAHSGRSITGWTTGLLLAGVLPQYLVSSLVVEMRNDFEISDGELGAAIGISFALSAIASPLAGRALRTLGIRRGVLLSATIVTAGSVGLATVADSAAAVIALMALNGIGSGIGSPSYSSVLAARVGAHRHGIAFGLLTSAPQMAAFSAGIALPLIAQPFSWRVTFVLAALLGVTCLVALERSGLPRSPPREPGDGGREPVPRLHYSVWTLAGATALASAAGIGMRSFLVVFAVSVGFSDAGAGLLLAASGLIALVSRLGFGFLGDRGEADPLRQTAWLMVLCAVGLALMATGGVAGAAAGAIIAGGLGWGWNAPMSLAVVSQNRSAVGAAVGVQMAGFFAGASVGPLIVGFFAGHASYTSAWVICAALAAAGAVATMVARRQRPHAASTAGTEDFPLS